MTIPVYPVNSAIYPVLIGMGCGVSYSAIMKKDTGFTLIELMISVAVLAIVLTIGVPSFREMIMNNRLTAAANEFATALSMTRLQAIKFGTGAVLQAPSTSPASNEWGKGFTVAPWDDADSDGVVDSGEVGTVIRTSSASDAAVTLDSTNGTKSISFLHTGALNGTASLTFNLCDSRTGETGRQFVINVMGKYSLDRSYTCP